MALLANVNGEKVPPVFASDDDSITCHECGEEMDLVDSHMKGSGVWVASYFRHARGTGGDCGGESTTHEKMKSLAAQRLKHEFDVAQLIIDEKFVGEKMPDVLAYFETPDPRMGKGIAVECQYRHDAKDWEEAESEFREHGLTTLWLEVDAFDFDGRKVDLDAGERVHPWPEVVPEQSEWEPVVSDSYIAEVQDDGSPLETMTVHLSPDCIEQELRRYWRTTDWEKRFPGDARQYIPEPEPTLPATFFLEKWLGENDEGYHQTKPNVGESNWIRRDLLESPPAAPARYYLIPERLVSYLAAMHRDMHSQETGTETDDSTTKTANTDDACASGNHNIELGPNGFRRCSVCEISVQTLVDAMDHELN